MTWVEIPVAIVFASGRVTVMSYTVRGRGSILPKGATWVDGADGWWERPATDENITRMFLRVLSRVEEDGEDIVGATWRRIEGPLPGRDDYRNSWYWNEQARAVVVDMPRARELHRELLRQRRVIKLQELDVEAMRALSAGQSVADIEARKQQLRDAPQDPRIDLSATVEDLKAIDLP